jgi:thioredoxin reductase (NADPH)
VHASLDMLPCYDAIVVGGGPAGLTGALYLARFRRRVLLVDDGDSRALRIPTSHNVPGFPDGVPGRALLASMREQAARHGVEFAAGRVETIARDADGDALMVSWAPAGGALDEDPAGPGADGAASACAVLLATGTRDIPPPVPHLARAIREGALSYCPVCDGYEIIGRQVGVITDSASGAAEALYLRHFSDRVTLYRSGADADLGEDGRERLATHGVALVEAPVQAIALAGDGVELTHGGERSRCDSLYGALGLEVRTRLAVALGADHDERGYLLTDRQQQTSVDGLYAAGDIVEGLNQISVAAGTAAMAASAIHGRLLARDGLLVERDK